MKIFITGGTGFIGCHVVKELLRHGHDVLLLSTGRRALRGLSGSSLKIVRGNLGNIGTWLSRVKIFRPEVCIHLAWEGIPDYGKKMSLKNFAYGKKLFAAMAEAGCRKIVASGSCWEYGAKSGKISESRRPFPGNNFAAAKNNLRVFGEKLARKRCLDFTWVRIFYVYGPSQRNLSLLPFLIKSRLKNKLPVLQNPWAANDFVYVGDVAKAIRMIAERPHKSGRVAVYNIGSGKLTANQKLFDIVFKTSQTKKIRAKGFYADIAKIKKEIGWFPETSIENGVKKTIKYFNG